jgi:hypothetical protein
MKPVDGFLDLRDFVLGHVAALIFAILPRVQTVIGAVGTLAQNAQGAMFHAFDLEDLFQK